MGEFSKWLLHEDQKELFEYFFATVLTVVFLALAVVFSVWPAAGRAMYGWFFVAVQTGIQF